MNNILSFVLAIVNNLVDKLTAQNMVVFINRKVYEINLVWQSFILFIAFMTQNDFLMLFGTNNTSQMKRF